MNHEEENKPHSAQQRCRYQAQFDNRVYLCKVKSHKALKLNLRVIFMQIFPREMSDTWNCMSAAYYCILMMKEYFILGTNRVPIGSQQTRKAFKEGQEIQQTEDA